MCIAAKCAAAKCVAAKCVAAKLHRCEFAATHFAVTLCTPFIVDLSTFLPTKKRIKIFSRINGKKTRRTFLNDDKAELKQ